VSGVNGNGYKNFTRSKNPDFEGRVGVMPIKDLTLALGLREGKLGQDVYGTSTSNTNFRWDLLAAYHYSMFSAGAEYFNAQNPTSGSITGSKALADGYSLWGAVNPMERVAVFARYDHADLNKKAAADPKDTYYNVGVSYAARKGVDLAVVYKHDKNDSSATKSNEFGVWSQVKF
jgi:predicted porin